MQCRSGRVFRRSSRWGRASPRKSCVAAPPVKEEEWLFQSVFALRASPDTLRLRLRAAAPRVFWRIALLQSVFALRASPDTLRLQFRAAAPREAEGEAWSQAGSNR